MNATSASRWTEIVQGLRIPAIVAPMFLVSGPRLVIAACRAGVIGSFPTAYARTAADLERWLQEISAAVGAAANGNGIAPYAANLIVHPTNPRVETDLELICRYRVPIVIASVGNPARIVERVHAYGGVVLTDVARVSHVAKAAASGVDGIILLCAGAGGHTGWINPFAFLPAARSIYDGPLILAGSISDGRTMRAAQMLGAQLNYIGTRFIATAESDAAEDYRRMVIASGTDDIVLSDAVSGLPANWLRGSLQRLGYSADAKAPPGPFSAGDNFKAWRDIWAAGHGVGAISRVESVVEVVDQLAGEYQRAVL